MPSLPEGIEAGIAEIVAAEKMELVHADWNPGRRRGVLRLVIDKDGGVTLADCELVSKVVGGWLDVADPFPTRYDLEVSSPGLDRLFYRKDDYRKFAGKKVRVMLHKPLDGTKLLIGRLGPCDDERVVVIDEERKREYNIGFPDIRWTRLEIEL